MKNNTKICFGVFALLCGFSVNAAYIDFEDISDLTSVNDFYATKGIHFSNAISLTAGFSLNEFDYPPHSGSVAIGDDFAPIVMTFNGLASNISAYFTYGSQLTFSAYGAGGTLLGTLVNAGFDNLGGTELVSLSFSGVQSLTIAGEWDGSYMMDDLSFTLTQDDSGTVPEPSSLFLLLAGMVGMRRIQMSNGELKC